MRFHASVAAALAAVIVAGCAVPAPPPNPVAAPQSRVEQQEAQARQAQASDPSLKRKLAIARFTNETRYGRSLLTDSNYDSLGKQASDMLASRLVASGRFLVFERTDLTKIKNEQLITKQADLVGVDTLVIGSVTEFGRSTSGETGFLSSTKVQTARAKVDVRLVDARTGHVFFSASGTGEAKSEVGQVAGFGNKADYDATLNDRAIGAAISDLLGALMTKLQDRPWHTDILKVAGQQVFITGGSRQGLKVGDLLSVVIEGEKVRSQQSGFEMNLPPTPIATIRVNAHFGDNETNEGSSAEIVSGTLPAGKADRLYVVEKK
jgi:curli biogenesis system outer membrane secretion channel CsgG